MGCLFWVPFVVLLLVCVNIVRRAVQLMFSFFFVDVVRRKARLTAAMPATVGLGVVLSLVYPTVPPRTCFGVSAPTRVRTCLLLHLIAFVTLSLCVGDSAGPLCSAHPRRRLGKLAPGRSMCHGLLACFLTPGKVSVGFTCRVKVESASAPYGSATYSSSSAGAAAAAVGGTPAPGV